MMADEVIFDREISKVSNVLTKTHTQTFRVYDPSSAKPVVQYYEREPVGVNFNKSPIDGLRVTDKTLTSQIRLTTQEHFTLLMSFL